MLIVLCNKMNYKQNPTVELKNYKIISKWIQINKKEHSLLYEDIILPSAKSLQNFCSCPKVKQHIIFNIDKFNSICESEKEKKSYYEKIILNFDKIPSITNKEIIPYIIIFIGGINSINWIYNVFEENVHVPHETCYFDYLSNYLEYLKGILGFIQNNKKISIPYAQMDCLLQSLKELGIIFNINNNDIIYRHIKDTFLTMGINKILVIITPNSNLWIKSKMKSINIEDYSCTKFNDYNIYYNNKFIEKFMTKVAQHPRCTLCILSSMIYDNLKICWDGLVNHFKSICPKNVFLLDKDVHEEINDPNEDRLILVRSMKKILNYLDEYINVYGEEEQGEINETDIEYYNEKNIIILESDTHKITDTKSNSIHVKLFNEKYMEKDDDDKMDLKGDKIINYIVNILENCKGDIRDYIEWNSFN